MTDTKSSQWRCQNYGACAHADAKEPVTLELNEPFACPQCGSDMGIQVSGTGRKQALPAKQILIGVAALIALFLLVKLLTPDGETKGTGTTGVTPLTPPTPPPPIKQGNCLRYPNGLAMQVLARPKSYFYKEASPDTQEALKPRNFERLYVFDDKNPDWLQIGKDIYTPTGWMEKKDTVEWQNSLVVEYTSPDNRKPVLFFRTEEELKELCAADNPADEANELYKEITQQDQQILGDNFPVVSIEPPYSSDKLNLMPVLQHFDTDIGFNGARAKALQVTAAGKKRGATTLRDAVPPPVANKEELPRVKVDLVFVMDTTGSMQQWIEGAKDAIKKLVDQAPVDAGLLRLGFWGFQDNKGNPGIEYTTKNFTPGKLLAPAEFSTVLEGIKANKETPDSVPEDVFAGVVDAVKDTAWRDEPGISKIIVLIGDAPGLKTVKNGPKKAFDGAKYNLDAPQVRQIATDNDVNVVSIAIKNTIKDTFAVFFTETEKQFKILAKNGNRPLAFEEVSDQEPESYSKMLSVIAQQLHEQNPGKAQPGADKATKKALEIVRGILASAHVEVISEKLDNKGEVIVPRDITGWVLDRDIINSGVTSLTPNLLVTKKELNILHGAATRIIKQAEAAEITGGNFFDAIKEGLGMAAAGNRDGTLAGMLPAFLKGLPYKSPLMDKERTWFETRTPEQQKIFISEIQAKLSYYRQLNENPDIWKSLNSDANSSEYVAPIPMDQLL